MRVLIFLFIILSKNFISHYYLKHKKGKKRIFLPVSFAIMIGLFLLNSCWHNNSLSGIIPLLACFDAFLIFFGAYILFISAAFRKMAAETPFPNPFGLLPALAIDITLYYIVVTLLQVFFFILIAGKVNSFNVWL